MYAIILYEATLDVDQFGDEPNAEVTADCDINLVMVGESHDELRAKCRRYLDGHPAARGWSRRVMIVDEA